MKSIAQRVLLALLLLGLTVIAQAAPLTNLVSNGSMNFPNGQLAGWTFLNPGGEFWNSFEPGNSSPDGGTYFGVQDLDAFAPRKNVGGISQVIENLVVGAHYDLTFYSNEEHTNPNFLAQWRVEFGTQTGSSTLTNTTWVEDVFHFTASSTSQTLRFIATFLPGALPQILSIDGVSLVEVPVAVPVPAGGWLLVPALAGLVGLARRRSF